MTIQQIPYICFWAEQIISFNQPAAHRQQECWQLRGQYREPLAHLHIWSAQHSKHHRTKKETNKKKTLSERFEARKLLLVENACAARFTFTEAHPRSCEVGPRRPLKSITTRWSFERYHKSRRSSYWYAHFIVSPRHCFGSQMLILAMLLVKGSTRSSITKKKYIISRAARINLKTPYFSPSSKKKKKEITHVDCRSTLRDFKSNNYADFFFLTAHDRRTW